MSINERDKYEKDILILFVKSNVSKYCQKYFYIL